MDDQIGIHVIGSGFGESIVLELPGGTFGVIDCCCSKLRAPTDAERLKNNPTLRLLVHELHAESLEFVAVTHPHEDHVRGMSHILKYYEGRIGQIWMFDTFQEDQYVRYLRKLYKAQLRTPEEGSRPDTPGRFYLEMITVSRWVQSRCLTGRRKVRLETFNGYNVVALAKNAVHVHFLGPRSQRIQTCKNKILENVAQVLNSKLEVDKNWAQIDLPHNEVSPALLVAFKEARVVFGGDMEEAAWIEAVEDAEKYPGCPDLSCDFLKASHHGSTNGFCDGLLATFAKKGRLITVITPYTRHRLPSQEGVAAYRSEVTELFATNRIAATRSSRFNPNEIKVAWAKILPENPSWAGAADSKFVPAATSTPELKGIPKELRAKLRGNAALKFGLREDLILPNDEPSETRYRLSFYFDSNGREVEDRRLKGEGAGSI